MSEDIKEILESLETTYKTNQNMIDKYGEDKITTSYTFNLESIRVLLDYIINLQKYYNDNVNKYEELLVKYSDLQEENERLNNIIKNLENYLLDIGMPRDYLKELKDSDK